MPDRLPVTVLTGFLGAGKTTLLNRILAEPHGRRYAVIVNEFGEIGIDGALISGADEDLVEMSNGCICCTVRSDLVQALRSILVRSTEFDAVVVETTGLARPGPVAQTFMVEPTLAACTVLDSVTTLVDAKHVEGQLNASPEVVEQIALADQIVLNKIDLASAADVERIEKLLGRLNPAAAIHRARHADVALDRLLGRGGFDLARIRLEAASPPHGEPGHVHDLTCGGSDGHDLQIASVSLRSAAEMDVQRLETWLGKLLAEQGQDILRGKGVFAVAGADRPLVFQSVHTQFEGDFQRAWAEDEPRYSRVVFIGRHLDAGALQAGFEACASQARQ